MSGTMMWVALIAGEVMLLLFVLLLVAWLRNLSKQRRDKRAIRALIAKVKENRKAREEQIGRFLGARMRMEGEQRDNLTAQILHGELKLLEAFASIYRNRDATRAAHFFLSVESAIEPYMQLSAAAAAAAGPAELNGDHDAELGKLRKEVSRLEQELTVTMETLTHMLDQYATMFGGPEEGAGDGAQGGATASGSAAPAAAAEGASTSLPEADATTDPFAVVAAASPVTEQGAEARREEEPAAEEESPDADFDIDAVLAQGRQGAGGDAGAGGGAGALPQSPDADEAGAAGQDPVAETAAMEMDDTVLAAQRPGAAEAAEDLDIQLDETAIETEAEAEAEAEAEEEHGLLDMEGLFDESAPEEDVLAGAYADADETAEQRPTGDGDEDGKKEDEGVIAL